MKGLWRAVERLQCYDKRKNVRTCKKTSHCFHWKIVVYVSYSNYKIFGLGAGGSSLVIFITRQKLLHRRAGQIAHQLLKYKAGSFMETHTCPMCQWPMLSTLKWRSCVLKGSRLGIKARAARLKVRGVRESKTLFFPTHKSLGAWCCVVQARPEAEVISLAPRGWVCCWTFPQETVKGASNPPNGSFWERELTLEKKDGNTAALGEELSCCWHRQLCCVTTQLCGLLQL